MSRYLDVTACQWGVRASGPLNNNSTNYLVQTDRLTWYHVFINSEADVRFRKSTNGALTWGGPTLVRTGTVQQLAVWFDKWSGLAGGLIHMAYVDESNDDILYRTINTASSDALSTETTIFAGGTTAAGGAGQLTIARARGGNVYCRGCIDAGAEGGFFRLLNADVPNGAWASRTINEALATQDQMILMPGFGADDQDMIGIFMDTSASELSRQLYDDSANSWSETSIVASVTAYTATEGVLNFAATPDLTNSQVVLVHWGNVDTANDDLRCWTITENAITEKTNVVLNSGDDQGFCAIGIDTENENWYVWYLGKSDGSETWSSSLTLNFRASQDGGTTWSAESSTTGIATGIGGPILACPRFINPWAVGRIVNLESAALGPLMRVTCSNADSTHARLILGMS